MHNSLLTSGQLSMGSKDQGKYRSRGGPHHQRIRREAPSQFKVRVMQARIEANARIAAVDGGLAELFGHLKSRPIAFDAFLRPSET